MLAANNQYKPTTYGAGMTQQQLNNLYGTNPSLVTQNYSQGGQQTPQMPAGLTANFDQYRDMYGLPSSPSGQASSPTGSNLYNIGGAYYKDPGGSQRATSDEQSAYLIEQARNDPNNKTLASGFTQPYAAPSQIRDIYGLQPSSPTGQANNPYGYTLDNNGNKVWGAAGNEWMQTPAEPMEMSWEDALGRAGESVNPIYDSLRSRAEMEMYDTREALPQLLAARHGMAGTRGGRIASAYTDQTQKEAATMQDIEGRRQGATAEMAQAIKSMDDERAMRIWQESNNLALQKQQLMLQMQASQTDDWAKRAQIYMQMQGFSADEAQRALENDPLFWKNQMEVKRGDSDLAYKQASTQALLNEQDPEHWKNQAWLASNSLDDQYKKAQIAGLYNRSTGGVGSSGARSSGGSSAGGSAGSELNYNTALIRASELARADPRLADGEMNMADSVNYFTLPQLVDAYMTMLAYQQG